MRDAARRPMDADSVESVDSGHDEPAPQGPRKEKLWTADLVLAALVNFTLVFVFYAFMATMAVYAMTKFAVSDTVGGLAASIFIVGATATRLFAGNLTDLVGKQRVLNYGMLAFVVATAAYFVVENSFAALLVIRAIHGAVFALCGTAAMALAQTVIPRSRFAEGTSYFTLSVTLGTAAGPFIALHLVDGAGYEVLFAVSLIVVVIGLVLSLFLRVAEPPLAPEHRARLRRFRLRDMLHPAVLPVATFVLVIGVAYSGVLTYLESYGVERDLQAGVAVFFLVYASTMLVSRLIVGRVQDVYGDDIVVYLSIVAHAAGLGVLALASANWILLIAAGLIGAGFGTQMSALQVVAVKKVPRHRIGVAVSTYFFMLDLGVGVGPIFLGLLLNLVGLAALYAILAAVMLASALLYHAVHGREFGGRPT